MFFSIFFFFFFNLAIIIPWFQKWLTVALVLFAVMPADCRRGAKVSMPLLIYIKLVTVYLG